MTAEYKKMYSAVFLRAIFNEAKYWGHIITVPTNNIKT